MSKDTAPRSDLAAYGGLRHLAGRAVWSLRPGGPGVAGEAWALRWLSANEKDLWSRMPKADQRHAVGVSKEVAIRLGRPAGAGLPSAVLAAALLHDIGKVESNYGTPGRVFATLVALAAGRRRVAGWSATKTGWRRRVGLYVTHDAVGGRLLTEAGSDPLVVSWAAEHHLPPASWTVDQATGAALKAADDD